MKGKTVETEEIPAYCAVALAGLGSLPDTILSRAVIIRMRRRAPGETVEPFRRRQHEGEAHAIRIRLACWAEGIEKKLEGYWPDLPSGIVDRDADVWEPLIAVADEAGGVWPRLARVAAVALVALSKESTPSLGLKLLEDIRCVFGERDQLPTEILLDGLHQLEESPWGDLKGKPLDSRGLARRLKDYGVKPVTIRTATATPKGYRRGDFLDPWDRYLPPSLGYLQELASPAETPVALGASHYGRATSATGATPADSDPSGLPIHNWLTVSADESARAGGAR
jgi:hypothetical protein